MRLHLFFFTYMGMALGTFGCGGAPAGTDGGGGTHADGGGGAHAGGNAGDGGNTSAGGSTGDGGNTSAGGSTGEGGNTSGQGGGPVGCGFPDAVGPELGPVSGTGTITAVTATSISFTSGGSKGVWAWAGPDLSEVLPVGEIVTLSNTGNWWLMESATHFAAAHNDMGIGFNNFEYGGGLPFEIALTPSECTLTATFEGTTTEMGENETQMFGPYAVHNVGGKLWSGGGESYYHYASTASGPLP